jgi:HEAT repeat protein
MMSMRMDSKKLAILLIFGMLCASCGNNRESAAKKDAPVREEQKMADDTTLEGLFNAANWKAVDLAAKQGEAAMPAVRRAAASKNPDTRQLAMASAARIRGAEAGKILGQGLSDADLTVRVEAANGLSANPPPEAAPALLAKLAVEEDPGIKQALAMGAGYLPGDRTVKVLQMVAIGTDEVARTARMALAKLGDKTARDSLFADLASGDAYTRYTALGWMRYINDKSLAPSAKKLLYDKADAFSIGPVRAPKMRRVCDQAVDTLVHLLELKPPFPTSAEKIYTEAEINAVAKMAA